MFSEVTSKLRLKKWRLGDIGAFSKLSDTVTGDTLTSAKSPIVYDKIELPKPIIAMAIEPKTKADIDKTGHWSASVGGRRSNHDGEP